MQYQPPDHLYRYVHLVHESERTAGEPRIRGYPERASAELGRRLIETAAERLISIIERL